MQGTWPQDHEEAVPIRRELPEWVSHEQIVIISKGGLSALRLEISTGGNFLVEKPRPSGYRKFVTTSLESV